MEGVLPESALDDSLELLDVISRASFGHTCRALRTASCRVDAHLLELRLVAPDSAHARAHGPQKPQPRQPLPPFGRLRVLQALDLTGQAQDDLLEGLAGHLPKLLRLCCARSPHLTDRGLDSLAADASGARAALREVDLTFCPGTSYGATIHLRRAQPSLQLIRRLPVWLEGRFLTPFAGAGAAVETHTYYADGTFDFKRAQQSRGYVRYLREADVEDEGFLYDSLQYCNFEGGPGWPHWARFLYRPGVAVRAAARDEALLAPGVDSPAAGRGQKVTQQVLVAQGLTGMWAPVEWPRVPDAAVPLGGVVLMRQDGTQFPVGTRLDETLEDDAAAMVSCMEVQPLQQTMPPDSLVMEIEDFERERLAFENRLWRAAADGAPSLFELEQQLHRILGGT